MTMITDKVSTINPLLPSVPFMTRLANFLFFFILRRDHQRISYERRYYESVEEKSLS